MPAPMETITMMDVQPMNTPSTVRIVRPLRRDRLSKHIFRMSANLICSAPQHPWPQSPCFSRGGFRCLLLLFGDLLFVPLVPEGLLGLLLGLFLADAQHDQKDDERGDHRDDDVLPREGASPARGRSCRGRPCRGRPARRPWPRPLASKTRSFVLPLESS